MNPGTRVSVAHVLDVVHASGGSFDRESRLYDRLFLLEEAGLGSGMAFHLDRRMSCLRSEDVDKAVTEARIAGLLTVDESGLFKRFAATWERWVKDDTEHGRLIAALCEAPSFAVRLAAFAVFFAGHGYGDGWQAVATYVKDPAGSEPDIEAAKGLYAELREIAGGLPDLDVPGPAPR